MDIDIDLATNTDVGKLFPTAISASEIRNGELYPHLVGYYFQNIPVDPDTGISAITYKNGLEHGFFKIDLLHLKLLDRFSSKKELEEYMHREPNWELLQDENIVAQLFHLSKSHELLKKVKPRSVLELADCLALIRPGKALLINSYIKDKEAIRKELYRKEKPSDLRKSHAIPYAYLIIAQLNLIEETSNETQ